MVTLNHITEHEELPLAARAEIARLADVLDGAPAERRRGRRIHFSPAARPLVPWIREFLVYEAGLGATPATLRTYRLELLAFAAAVAGALTFDGQVVAWARVGSTDIKEYLRRYREQARTHNKKLVVIRAYYKWAVATERLPRDLTAGLGQADVQFVPSRALTKQQRRVLRRLTEDGGLPVACRALLALGYYLGLRASEAARLTTEDLIWSQRGPHTQCHVRVHGKRGRVRTLKLHPEALPILQTALAERRVSTDPHLFLNPAGKGITDKTVHAWIQAIMTRQSAILITGPEQGGRLLTYHDLRHTLSAVPNSFRICSFLHIRGMRVFEPQPAYAVCGNVMNPRGVIGTKVGGMRQGLTVSLCGRGEGRLRPGPGRAGLAGEPTTPALSPSSPGGLSLQETFYRLLRSPLRLRERTLAHGVQSLAILHFGPFQSDRALP